MKNQDELIAYWVQMEGYELQLPRLVVLLAENRTVYLEKLNCVADCGHLHGLNRFWKQKPME